MKITTNNFYLNNSMVISEKEIDAGATMFDNQWITNINVSTEIEVKKLNELSIYVPSTIDVDKINENLEETITSVKNKINEKAREYKTQGAWKAENGEIVFENICILTIIVNAENFENRLNDFIKLAHELKTELTQEGISIGINDGLMII